MAKNQEQRDRERDKRLRQTYGITLEQYNQILVAQDGKCAICGRPATDFSISLNVDHEHGKIRVRRVNSLNKDFMLFPPGIKWVASVELRGKCIINYDRTKKQAVVDLKKHILPLSVRGLLCPGRHGTGCNTKLGRADKIWFLEKALEYLKNPPARKIIHEVE